MKFTYNSFLFIRFNLLRIIKMQNKDILMAKNVFASNKKKQPR